MPRPVSSYFVNVLIICISFAYFDTDGLETERVSDNLKNLIDPTNCKYSLWKLSLPRVKQGKPVKRKSEVVVVVEVLLQVLEAAAAATTTTVVVVVVAAAAVCV